MREAVGIIFHVAKDPSNKNLYLRETYFCIKAVLEMHVQDIFSRYIKVLHPY